ncbi:MAG: hypothetical protein ABSC51_07565 [Gaiellaceae bacterium]
MDTNQNESVQNTSSEPATSTPEPPSPGTEPQAITPAETDQKPTSAPDQGEELDDPEIPANEPPLQEPLPLIDESAPIPHLRLAEEPPPAQGSQA